MAANTADTLNNIESALGSISSSLGGFIGNKNYDDGIKKIESILTNNFRKTSAKNAASTGTTNGGRTLGNTIGEMLGVLKGIKNTVGASGSISSNVKDVNKNIKDAVDLLRQIDQHIGNTPSNSTITNSNTPTNNIGNIDKNVGDILDELRKVTLILARSSYKTGDNDLDKKLLRIAKMKATKEEESLRISEIEEKVKSGKASKLEKDYIRLKAKKDKKGEKELEKLRGGRTKTAVGIVKGVSNTFTGFVREKPDASKTIDKGISTIGNFGAYGAIAAAILQAVKALFDLGAEQDKLTTKFAREFGGGYRGKYNAGETVRNFIGNANRRYGFTNEEAYAALTEVGEARGRTTERMSNKAIESSIMLKRFGIGADAINNFDTFGKSIEETDKYFAKLYSEVSKKGLSFKNVSKAVNDNLKAAQSHTFSNGLRGLEQMAEKSVQLKYNMQQVFQFADKVSEVEGAISTAANLSVLGGTFAQYSNPMQMLYEGLNDMEALQTRIEKTFGEKAFWNQEKGQMDMTAYDREIVKQAAKSMGLDPNEMLSLSYNQGKMKRIEGQLGNVKGLDKDTVNYIKNIAELNDKGHAYVTLNGKDIAVSGLNESHKELLEKESKRKDAASNAKLGDIYKDTMAITEKMDNLLIYLKEQLGRWVFGMFQKIAGRQIVAEDNVTKWAEDKKIDKDTALDFYRENKDKFKGWKSILHGHNPFRGYSDTYFSEHMDDMVSEFGGINGKSPNGFNPSKYIPGYSGILKGRSHMSGGIFGFRQGSPWEAEGGEFLINKLSSSKYKGELVQIQNGTFNPYSYANDLIKNDMNKYFNQMKVAPSQNRPNVQNEPVSSNAVNGRIKIDIPETITINLAGGEKIGDYDVREIVMAYVDKFMKEATMRKNFSGFNKEEFYNKSDVI